MSLEAYFSAYRNGIVGNDLTLPDGDTSIPVIYADWTASGRLYHPIEDYLLNELGPYVANTHTETTLTGSTMTKAYHDAQHCIKDHVNADDNDVIICGGAGMTALINKFQRLLGVKIPEKWQDRFEISEDEKPLVLITHMEHHSNQTTWSECAVTLEMIPPDEKGLPDLNAMQAILTRYASRAVKIGSFTACSNVTGIKTPYYQMAEIMHKHEGLCFIDFAASAPYVDINMHPANPLQKLDAIFISPHKFLGGPGSSGVMVFDKKLYTNKVPDQLGGGTVTWTNPWGEHRFFDNIEVREDGGTPAFLQTIKVALAIKVKESMGVDKMALREKELTNIMMDGLKQHPSIHLLEDNQKERLCIVSLYVIGIHYNLIVRLLNDKFGIQTRGGCSCAGTYGHILLGVDEAMSHRITDQINQGDVTQKPGWVRISLHPTSTDAQAHFIVDAVKQVVDNAEQWSENYNFSTFSGEFEKHQKTLYKSIDEFSPLGLSPEPNKTLFDRLKDGFS
ncbi:MAG: selenocysteine lyase/cysteine desulfurase [Alteromonadaceae bacterium]|jgi:selenocysteine lyase/cysteine desulfurase